MLVSRKGWYSERAARYFRPMRNGVKPNQFGAEVFYFLPKILSGRTPLRAGEVIGLWS